MRSGDLGFLSKRTFDVAGSMAALLLFGIPMLIVAVLVRLIHGSPVLFTQTRPGLNGRPFRMIKFRSMRDAFGPDGEPLSDELRLTRLGRILRATSLDEVPELFNVLKGEMSLVGPRPLLMKYLPLYTPEQARRHEVRPGITGLAQVKGRNALCWEERFAMDVWYIDHWSLGLDIKILFLTVSKVVKRSDVAAAGEATMSEFRGSPELAQR